MKIVKYEKKKNGKYKIYLENKESINTYEDVIIKNNLLYKKDIDNNVYNSIMNDNIYEEAYNKSVNYIGVRLRSVNEIRVFLKNKKYDGTVIETVIDKLLKNNLLNDEVFVKAFINDKLNFTTMGPYKIELELKKHNIDGNIISTYIASIDEDILYNKIKKLIDKSIKSNKKHSGSVLKNKIYNSLLNLGYKSSMVLDVLREYEF